MKRQKEKEVVLYVHGKGGTAMEAEHYRVLFPGCDVLGLDYQGKTPWETVPEIRGAIERFKEEYESIVLIANSIGAYFSMKAGIDRYLSKAFFISPIVDMEKLILDLMDRSNVTEKRLKEEKTIPTAFGEDLSWEYLNYVRSHPIFWKTPTEILFGAHDELISFETVEFFAKKCGAGLTVVPNGEHWFHTEEQMLVLDRWLLDKFAIKEKNLRN